MTRDDIIRLAREAKIPSNVVDIWFGQISDFVALVAAHEREACAKVCDDLAADAVSALVYPFDFERCAAAIRARGD